MTTLLTRKEVAERLGVSYNRVGKIMETMPVVRIGGRIRINEADLDAWIASHTDQPIRIAPPARENKPGKTVDGKIPTRAQMRRIS